jgi:hypothetical protein
MAACVPYLSLKIAWASGSRIGIPDGSSLLEHRSAMIAGSVESALLDSLVVVLVLLLTQPWGRRVPGWILVVPFWTATGLLTPIVVGYPLQLGARLLGGYTAPTGGAAARPFLHEWVFTVVYTGFIVQALALGALFALYARARWGRLWQGRISGLARRQGPMRGVQRAASLLASAMVLVPLGTHLLWATGSRSGLTSPQIADRTSDFYALEATYVVLAVMTLAGLLLVALPGAGALPLRVPLLLAFVGSAALGCWGGYLMLTALGDDDDPSRRISELMNLTYTAQLLTGVLVFTVGAYYFAERAERRGPPPRAASAAGVDQRAARVEVRRVTGGVGVEEGPDPVEAAGGLLGDQRGVAEVDELGVGGGVAEVLRDPLRDLVEPDTALVVLGDDEVGDVAGVGADVRRAVDPLG